jgi:hypothetical protein
MARWARLLTCGSPSGHEGGTLVAHRARGPTHNACIDGPALDELARALYRLRDRLRRRAAGAAGLPTLHCWPRAMGHQQVGVYQSQNV